MKFYDSMGFESENGIWVRRADVAEFEAILAIAERRDAFKLATRIRELEAARELAAIASATLRDESIAKNERIAQLEAALLAPKAAEWKYLDDGVTLLKAALDAIPERYQDGEPNQLHYAIKEWLSRPERAALAPKEPT